MTIKELIASKLRPIGDSIRTKKGVGGLIPIDDMPAEIDAIVTSDEANELIKMLAEGGTFNKDIILPSTVTVIRANLFKGIRANNIYFPNVTRLLGYLTDEVPNNDLVTYYFSNALNDTSKLSSTYGLFAGNVGTYGKVYFDMTVEEFLKRENLKNFGNCERIYFKNDKNEYEEFLKCDVPESVSVITSYKLNARTGMSSGDKFAGQLQITLPNNGITLQARWYYYNNSTNTWNSTQRLYDLYVPKETVFEADWFRGSVFNKVIFEKEFTEIPANFAIGNSSSYIDGANEFIFDKPNSITSIGNSAFENCKLYKFTIPPNVTNIGSKAFKTSRFTEITIPAKVNTIGSSAFEGFGNKCTYIFEPINPPTLSSGIFAKSLINKIYVPKGSANAYKTATNWSTYADYIMEPHTVTVSIPATLLNNENYTYSIDGDDFQQFTASSLTLENIATFKIKNSGDVTINVGTTDGGTEIGSVGTGAELLYATESDITIYLTVA